MKYEKFINLFYDRFILFHFIATVLLYWTIWSIEMCSKFLFDIKQVYLLPLITILIFQNCLYMYLKNEDFVFRHNYGFWFFPLNQFTFPCRTFYFFWILDFPIYTETYKKIYVTRELTIVFRWLETDSCHVQFYSIPLKSETFLKYFKKKIYDQQVLQN